MSTPNTDPPPDPGKPERVGSYTECVALLLTAAAIIAALLGWIPL